MIIDSNDPAAVKTLASELLEGLGPVISHEMQRSTDAGKWSLSALLTINGGAVLAILSSEARFADPITPACMFSFGMLLALASAAALRADIKGDIRRAERALRYAKRVVENRIGAPSNVEELQAAWGKGGRARKLLSWVPVIAEVCSALLFLAGALWSIGTINPGKVADERRCEALQSDMLSAQPRRVDSKELFAALKCSSQGAGSVFAKPRIPALPHQDKARGGQQIESTASSFPPSTSFKLGSP